MKERCPRLAATVLTLTSVVASHCGGSRPAEPPAAATRPATGGPATTQPTVDASSLQAPAALGLRPVPLPEVPPSEVSVLDQINRRRDAVVSALNRPDDRAALAAAYGDFGKVLHAATAFEGAEAAYSNAEQLAPDDPRWPYYLGQLFRSRGPLQQASQSFERARTLNPRDLATTTWLADVYLAEGRPEAAEPLFTEALNLNEASAAAHFGAGRTALARRDYDGAIRHLERAQALDPRATAIHYPLAMAYRGRGDLAKAESALAKRGDLEPRPADPLMQELDALLESAEAYNIRGGAEMTAGNWKAAADQFRRGLELRRSDPSLRHRLGTALAQMGDGPGAVAAFEQVIRSHPEYARAYFSLAVIAAETGRLDVAISQLQTALKHEPGYVEARVQLGWALSRSGRPGESLTQFEQALALEPAHADAAFGYGMALVRLQRWRDARQRLDDAWRLNPNHFLIGHALARILAAAPDDRVRSGAQARAIVDRLLAAQGQSLELGETTAMMLAELRRFQEAATLQQDLIAGAQRLNAPNIVARLTNNLQRYERGEACRVPFTDDEIR